MERTRTGGRSGRYCRLLLCVLSTIVCAFHWTLFGSFIRHHETLYSSIAEQQQKQQHHYRQAPQQQRLQLSAFEAPTRGELRSTSTNPDTTTNSSGKDPKESNTSNPFPTRECAINLYGLPRSFKHHVLPSLINHVISVNSKYQCDYFVHFYNVTTEKSETNHDENRNGNGITRGGNAGGTLHPEDIYLLKDAVNSQQERAVVVDFFSDTDEDFARDRKDYIEEIVQGSGSGGDQASNPYFVKEASFTSGTLLNILKMWHSQDRVWNLMERQQKHLEISSGGKKRYKRVAMLRLDVIYTTPIDVYSVPTDTVPVDYNDAYLNQLRKPQKRKKAEKAVTYFYEFGTASKQKQEQKHCVVPGFKSFPVNDRYFAGPYEAVEIWAKDRFSRAKKHVMEVLPKLESQRLQAEAAGATTEAVWGPVKFTDFGLHDERFVAYTILPAIRESNPNISIHVDRDLWFVRVRADGSIWLKDKPGYGRVATNVLETALGRKCTGEVYEVLDPILEDKSPGRWQIKCPPHKR